jgi:putative acetyltransferase
MQVRRYRPEETEVLMRLFYDTVHSVNSRDYTPEQIAAWAPEAALDLPTWQRRFAAKQPMVAVEGESLLGFVELDANGQIDCFYVHHEHQRAGVGTALMDAVVAEGRRRRLEHLLADVSITGRAFFTHHGFKVLREQLVELRGQKLRNYVMFKLLK